MSVFNIFPVAFLDAPRILDTGVTPIPGNASAPLQVVANIGGKAAHAIDYVDSTGDFIGVYTGVVGQEKLRCIIGGGVVARAFVVIAAKERVSFRSMTASPITNGKITCSFMGMGMP